MDVNYTILIREKNTDKVEEIKETHKILYLFQTEVDQMLSLSELSLINAQEWLSSSELSFSAWNGCFVAVCGITK